MKVLVAYDGSLDSKAALKYGIRKVREHGGELIALHVFHSQLFVDYEAGPWASMAARRESADHVKAARALLQEQGRDIRAALVIAEGNPDDEILEYAKKEEVDLIVSPPVHEKALCRACCLLDVVTA